MFEKDDHLEKHWRAPNKPLSNGIGILTEDVHIGAGGGGSINSDAITYGYYLYSDFASMATYFRKMRTTPLTPSGLSFGGLEIIHLTTGSSSNFDVQYPQGTYWKDHPTWDEEFGTKPGQDGGYTARWKADSGARIEGNTWALMIL
jgi:hypothetical protein